MVTVNHLTLVKRTQDRPRTSEAGLARRRICAKEEDDEMEDLRLMVVTARIEERKMIIGEELMRRISYIQCDIAGVVMKKMLEKIKDLFVNCDKRQ